MAVMKFPLSVGESVGRPFRSRRRNLLRRRLRTSHVGVTPGGALRGIGRRRRPTVTAVNAIVATTPSSVSGSQPATRTTVTRIANAMFPREHADADAPDVGQAGEHEQRRTVRRPGRRRRSIRRWPTGRTAARAGRRPWRPADRVRRTAWRRRGGRNVAANRLERAAATFVRASRTGRVVIAVMAPRLLRYHCQIDARRCQLLPTAGQRR